MGQKLTAAAAWAALLGVVLIGALVLTSEGDLGGAQPNRRQNTRGIAINANTTWDGLFVNQTSTGNQFQIEDSGTPVAVWPDGRPARYPLAAPIGLITSTTPIAPVRMIQPVVATGTASPNVTIPAAGVYGCIYNSGTAAITLTDSGNLVLSGNLTLGQYDTVCGFSDGTRFIQTTTSNN